MVIKGIVVTPEPVDPFRPELGSKLPTQVVDPTISNETRRVLNFINSTSSDIGVAAFRTLQFIDPELFAGVRWFIAVMSNRQDAQTYAKSLLAITSTPFVPPPVE